MNTKEVASYLKVAESTVAKYAQKGKLSFRTEKRCKVYELEDVKKLQQKIEEDTDCIIFKGRERDRFIREWEEVQRRFKNAK